MKDPDLEDALTSTEAAAAAGITLAEWKRLWRALGFPDAGDEAAFTQVDLAALSQMLKAAEAGDVDFHTAVRLTRAVGQTMARLADWQVATLATQLEHSEVRIADHLGAPFEQLLVYAWRRHVGAAMARLEAMSASDDEPNTIQVTVGFADLVNFTALSNELDEDRIGELVEIFESRCGDVVATHKGRVIKTLGDSVLFVAEEPEQAMQIALGIIEVIGEDARLPDVRIGLASGSVVTRLGDVFGPPVNLAARLTAVARRNRVIADHATVDRLPPEQYLTRALSARPVRGFGFVEPVAVRLP